MRDVQDLLTSLAGQWKSLSREQQQNLGLQIAGRYQLSRFLILMDQFEEAQKASTTALNSEGSAYRENEAFLDSYQAKLNQLANSWTTLSTTMGEAVLGSGIVVVSESLTSIANATSFVVDKIGLLPPLFTIAGAAFLAFNNHTRTSITSQGLLASSLVRTGDAMSIATGRSRVLQQQLYNLTLAGRATATSFGFMGKALGGALSFITTAALPLAAFAAFGAAISFATNKIVEHRQAQKEAKEEIDKLTKTYGENETQIESLISRYEQLDKQVSDGSLSATDKEYLQVQQELYTLLPSVAESVDEKGQAHLRSADAIRQEVGYLKELSRVDAEKFITDFQSKLGDLNDQIKDTQDKLNEISERQNSGYSELIPWFGVREKAQLEDMADSIIGRRDIEAKLEERKRLFQELGKSYSTYYGVQDKVTEEDQKHIDTIVAKNSELLKSKDGIKQVENEVKAYIGSVGEIRRVSGNLFDTKQIQHLATYNKDAVNLFNEMSTAMKKGNKDWDSYGDKLKKVGLNGEEVASVLNLVKTGHDEATGATIAYVDANEEAVEVEEDRTTSAEKLAGVTKDQLDSIYELIGTYKVLSSLEADNANKSEELLAVTDQLAAIYPHLVKNKEINIATIEQEAKAQDILLKAVEDLTAGKLTKEQEQTLVTALHAKKRIDILKQELAAQQAIVQKFNEMSKTLADNANTLEQEKLASKAYDRAKKLTADIDLELPDFNAQIDALGTVIEYKGRDSAATEKMSESYEEASYVTDKFKKALESLNLELAEQDSIQSRYSKHSKEYQKSLQDELKLLYDKKDLIKEQARDLNKQISSGTIKQTGLIKTSGSGSSYSGKYSSEINKAASTYGVDPYLIAAMIQAESSFNPNARSSAGAQGLMQLMPATARSLGVTNAYDPAQNIMGGTKYIAQQIEKFGGDIEKALWAYNAGAGNVSKILNSGANSWTGVKAYADKIIAQFGKTNQAISSTASNVADYYLNNFRQTSQFGSQESFRKSPHKGLDLSDGKSGSVIKALQSGKVITATYSKSAGNWVVVQQDDGSVAKYMHMLKTPEVKAGQRVAAGQRIGQVGNTGDSKGAHLHLQIEQNGKPIDPKQYLEGLKTGQSVAEQLQSLDQAVSELNQLNGDVLAVNEEIRAMQREIVDAQIASYEYSKQNADNMIQNSENRLKMESEGSEAYRKELETQQTILARKQKVNANEMAYLRYVIKEGKLSASAVDELNQQLHELGLEKNEMNFQQQELSMRKINSVVKEFTDSIAALDHELNRSRAMTSVYATDTENYNQALLEQESITRRKMELTLQERDRIRDLMRTEKLSATQKEELKNKVNELSLEYWNLKDALQDVDETIENLRIDKLAKEMDKAKKSIDDALSVIDRNISRTDRDDFSAIINLNQQKANEILRMQDLAKRNIDILKSMMATMTTQASKDALQSQIDQWETTLRDSVISIEDLQYDMMQVRKDIARQAIDAMKDYYQERQRIETDAIDDQIEAENRRHEQVMKNYDDELDKFNDTIQAMIDAIDRTESERDFNKDIQDSQKRAQDIQSRIDVLAMDNSHEAKAQRLALEEELATLLEEINEKRHDREIELRKENLSDMQKNKQDEIDDFKETEDEKHDSVVDRLEDDKRSIENHYNEILNDTRYFAQLEQDIINGSVDNIQGKFGEFVDYLMTSMPEVGQNIRLNLIDALNEAIALLNDVPTSIDIGTGGGSSGGSSPSTPSSKFSTADMQVLAGKFLMDELRLTKEGMAHEKSVKDKAYQYANMGRSAGSTISSTQGLSSYLGQMTADDKKQFAQYLISTVMPNILTPELKNYISDYAAKLMTSSISGTYHSGGIVGNQPKNKFTEMANKLFNLKPNETLIKSLKGELMIPQGNIMSNFLPNMQNLANSLVSPQMATTGGNTFHLNMRIDNLNGTKQDGDMLLNRVVKGLDKLGALGTKRI